MKRHTRENLERISTAIVALQGAGEALCDIHEYSRTENAMSASAQIGRWVENLSFEYNHIQRVRQEVLNDSG